MPIYTPYPGPGAGISTAGLNKTGGWGSPGLNYMGDAGINKTQGKKYDGLDQRSNPVITSFNVTGITGTGATITWTTNVARPLGSVRWRLASGGAWTTVAEAGTPPLTTHAVPLTGLALSKVYEYEVTQPGGGTGSQVGKQVYQGRFTTLAAGALAASKGDGLMNTTGVTDSRDLLNGSSPSSSPPAFPINQLQAVGERDEVTVTWRTEVYADGTVMYRPVGGQAATVDEMGVKRLNHSVTLSGLAPNTEYEVAVISADAQGNTSEAGPIRVRTTA